MRRDDPKAGRCTVYPDCNATCNIVFPRMIDTGQIETMYFGPHLPFQRALAFVAFLIALYTSHLFSQQSNVLSVSVWPTIRGPAWNGISNEEGIAETFLCGFPAAVPFGLAGKYLFTTGRWVHAWRLLMTALDFSAFYWSSVAFLLLRSG